MTKLLALLLASTFAVTATTAIAADPAKDQPPTKGAQAPLERPANVSVEAWNKMTDAEKAKAIAAAKSATADASKTTKKEKKGGC